MKKRRIKKNNLVSVSDSPAPQHNRLPHGGLLIDRIDSNWKQLQATLKKGPAAKRIRSSPKSAQQIEPAKDTATVKERQTVVLSPRNADCSLTRVLAMDCEMVGVGLEGKRSVLARVSLVNTSGNVIYDKHVCPIERVTDFRTHISGVRAHDLRKAEKFTVVQREVAQLLLGRVLVGHAVHNDLKVMFLSHPKKDIRDTSRYPPLRSENGRPRALRHLAAELLGVEIQTNGHCSVQDARAAMYIYDHLKQQWEDSLSRRHKF